MFDYIHQKFCHNKVYLAILERVIHIPCCIFVYSFIAYDSVKEFINKKRR